MFGCLVIFVIFLQGSLDCSGSRSGSAGSSFDTSSKKKISIEDALKELGMDPDNLVFTQEDVTMAFKKRFLELHPFNYHGASKAILDEKAKELVRVQEAQNIAKEFALAHPRTMIDLAVKSEKEAKKYSALADSRSYQAAKSAQVAQIATEKVELEHRVAQKLREQKEADRLAAEQEGLRAATQRLEDQKRAAERFSASPSASDPSFDGGLSRSFPTPGSSRLPAEATGFVGVRSSRSDSLGSLYSNPATESLNSYGRRLTIYEALRELKMDPSYELTPKEIEERYLHRLLDYADDKYLRATREDLDRREKSLQDLHQAKHIVLEFHKMPPVQRQNAVRHAQEVEKAEKDEWERAIKLLVDKRDAKAMQDAKTKDIDPDL